MAKSNFIVRGGGDFSGLYKEFNKAQKKMNTFQKGIQKSLRTLGTIIGTVAIGKLVKDSTQAAMTVESSIENISRNMGESAKVFQNWVETQSRSFAMAKNEAYQYGSTFSNLLGSFITDSQETSNKTQELMKAAAIIANKTGRTYDDVANRIRSGMLGSTEAIEDLGVYTQVSMLESTEAFKKFAGDKSWNQLDFQTQQQIRLNAILEQSFARYGDTLAGTTQTKQQIFLATLKDIRLNLGQAFLPIYNVILPALTSLASKIEYVTRVFAQFSQAIFGKSTQVQTKQTQEQAAAVSELGDATEEAGKQAKNAVAGFDEINQLSLNESGSGEIGDTGIASIAEASELNTIDDETGGAMGEVATKAQEMATKVKEAFATMKNTIVQNKNIIIPSIGAISGALIGLAMFKGFNNVIDGFRTLKRTISLTWATLKANPIMLVAAGIGALIGAFILAYTTNEEFREKVNALWNAVKSALTPAIQKLGEILSWVWQNIMVPLGQFLANTFVMAWNVLTSAIQWLWQNILIPFGNFLIWLWQTVLLPVATVVRDVLAIAFDVLGSIATNVWQNVLVPLGQFLTTVLAESIKAVADILKHWWNNILVPLGVFIATIFKPIIEALSAVFMFLWNSVLKPLVEFMAGVFMETFETLSESIGEIIEGLKTTFKGLIDFIAGVFTNNWKRAWEGVKNIFKGIFDSLYGFVKVPLNLIISAINKVISGLNKLKIDIPDWVPGVGGKSWGINISKIPKLARGGIITSPTIAMIGEQGPEAVVPLENTGFVDAIASAVGTAVMSAIQVTRDTTSQDRELILQVDGTKIARVILPKLDSELQRIGAKSIIQTT